MIAFKGFLKEGTEKAPLPKTKEETERNCSKERSVRSSRRAS